MFWVFGPQACEILAPWPGIKPVTPASGGEILTIGLPRKSLQHSFLNWIIMFLCTVSWASQEALVVKNPPANPGDIRDGSSVPGSGRSPGGGHSNLLQYSCLENPMDKRAWQAIVHRVRKRQTWLKWLSMYIREYIFFFRFFSLIGCYKIFSIVLCPIV